MREDSICYITLYYDIGRSGWTKFNRTFEEYLEHFKPFISLLNKDVCGDDEMLVFIDERYFENFNKIIKEYRTNIKIIAINDNFLSTLPMWKTADIEQEIMNNEEFKKKLGVRREFPEHNYSKYTLINHCKIDLIAKAIDMDFSKNNYYAWVDFGFFKLHDNIPCKLLDINKFEKEKINYTLINPINENDNDVNYNLMYAREKIGGFFFLGSKEKMIEYQKVYHKGLDVFQKILSIADDDQHLVLQLYFMFPEMFCLHMTDGFWHTVFKYFQKIKL